MVQAKTFGRRAGPQPALARTRGAEPATGREDHMAPAALPMPVHALRIEPEVDTLALELRDWKGARKQGFTVPWRQLSLMAGLCFGVASFVLPASVNDAVQWPLYALMAASLYAGFAKRRRKAGI